MQRDYDVAIVGGGVIGSTLACAIAASSLRIALLESQQTLAGISHSNRDGRSFALAVSSKNMLDALGVWEKLGKFSVAIKNIHISERGKFGAMRVNCQEHGSEGFGYLVPAERLALVLHEYMSQHQNIDRIQPYMVSGIQTHADKVMLYGEGATIEAKLLIAADGTHSFIRKELGIPVDEKPYGQTAVVGNIGVTDYQPHTAYVRFTAQGPLVLVPRSDNCYGFIWTNPTKAALEHLALSEKEFSVRLQQAFGFRLGHFCRLGKRYSYPLSLKVSQRLVSQRAVLIGNAAQTLHPVVAQGLNLAFRDIAELSELLHGNKHVLDNISEVLHSYESKRQSDIKHTVMLTNRLNFLFSTGNPVLAQVRGIGLALLGAVPALENQILQHSSGTLSSSVKILQGRALQYS